MSTEIPGTPVAPEHVGTGPSQQDLENALRAELVKQQDVLYALVGGLASAIVGAVIWAVITVSTGYQIGYMAIGVGLLVGFSVRFFGEGIEKYFGFIGAFFALFGCALGNLLSQLGFIAHEQGIGYFETISYLNPGVIAEIYKSSFSPMDVFFYAIAAYEGYRFGFKKIEEELVISVAAGKVVRSPIASFRLQVVIGLVIALAATAFAVSRSSSALTNLTYESGAKKASGTTTAGREDGPWEFWWENGNLQAKGSFIGGKFDGAWEFYSEDGARTRTSNWKNGNQHGEQLDYYASGTVSTRSVYVNGRQHGLWIDYFENGEPSTKGSFALDREDGDWEWYNETGQLLKKGSYSDGVPVGRWTSWFDNGNKNDEVEYVDGTAKYLNAWSPEGKQVVANGNGRWQTMDAEGNVIEEGSFKDGFKDGGWTRYFSNGKKSEEGEYRGGVYYLNTVWSEEGEVRLSDGNGQFTSYYPDGSTLESGLIKDGLREGKWTTGMFGSSSILMESEYKGGKLNGPQINYAESGYVAVQGSHLDDRRDGEWKWFSDEDQLESVVTYVNGRKEGNQLFYSAYGELLRTEVYKDGELIETQL